MENNKKEQKLNIFYFLKVFLSHWPLFLISCIIFLSIGIAYYVLSAKTFNVSSRVLFHTDQMRTRANSEYVNVNDLMNQDRNRTNELAYLSSTPLISEVVENMNLFTTYYLKSGRIPDRFYFCYQNIYKSSPFIVIVDKDSPQPLNTLFQIEIIDENNFRLKAETNTARLYNFQNESMSEYQLYFHIDNKFKFGEDIKTKYSSFKVLLNSNYEPSKYHGKDLFFKFNSPEGLSIAFQKSLTIESSHFESSITNLSFEWDNFALAKEFLTQLINIYIKKNLEKKNYNADKTIEYIEQQLATISGSLGQSERQLQNFRTNQAVMNISDKTRELMSQKQNFERNKDLLETQLQNQLRLKEYFDKNKNSSTFIIPASMGMSDASLATLIEELTTLSREKQNLVSTNQLKNPRIKTLDANMATIIKVITENIEFNISTTRSELATINNRLLELNLEFDKLPQTQRQLIELEREYNINDAVYTSLLDRRIQAKILKASNMADCEIIEPVRYEYVASPSAKKIGVIYLFLGLFFPSVYIILTNFLTPKVISKEELSFINKIPIIGEIPHSNKNRANLITNYPQEPIVERFHALRGNLLYYLLGNTNQTILITSTLPNEGKSFTSLNLALSFATANYKTLLIAFDLRKNSDTFKELNANTLAGLDSFLINRANIEDIIATTDFNNLHFMSNIEIPPNPSALLSSPKIKELLETVKSFYDYVIIDTPPFGLVSDAFLLMQHVDLSIYISRLGTVTKKALKQNMVEIDTKTKNTYLVINDLTRLDKPYYGKYSYVQKKKKKFSLFRKTSLNH